MKFITMRTLAYGFAFILLQPTVALSENTYPIASLGKKCIDFETFKLGKTDGEVRECAVTDYGELGNIETDHLSYALYCLLPSSSATGAKCGDSSFDASYHARRAMSIFSTKTGTNVAKVIFKKANPDIGLVYYDKPEIVLLGGEKILVLPIHLDGTGAGNESEYYVWQQRKWIPIDSKSWLSKIQEKIPADLAIWKGIWPDLKTMKAETGLFKKDDANCCPTGGIAKIDFKIRANAFVVEKISIEPFKTP